jgi:hypothetical protein
MIPCSEEIKKEIKDF